MITYMQRMYFILIAYLLLGYYDKGEQGFIYNPRNYPLRFRIRNVPRRQKPTSGYSRKRQRNQNVYAQMGKYQRTQKPAA